ncbi:MurR/RpiR family transcriptional regulator [Rhodovulum kholense]|uniref:RpiR family transcriptional regulator n=1 Tax=Rhodovulum kholense TaxID=453584 RepID=A0A8E2VLF7_9RHOB|nr:MurR/RpiR family transcriptional regulator [Rhodovulum kholense]PTW50612.1 RpiR family transcriptional regulator [Rhodovulum kholense]
MTMPGAQMEDGAEPAGSLLKRIHRAYDGLPGGERKVADAILSAPHEMAVWTASELAAQAGVSNATVSRIVQRLGYRNFESARLDARKLRETGSPLFMTEETEPGQEGRPFARLIRAEADLIEATLTRVDPALLREAAGALGQARRVRVMGFRNSRFLADYLTAQLAQIRPDVAPLLLDGQTAAEGIAGLGPEDVAVIVGLRRRPARFSRLVQAVAARGARVLLVCDASLRGAPAHAVWTFTCAVETRTPRDSYAGALALMRLLATDCAAALGEAGLSYLNEVETLREDLDELELSDPGT